MRNHIKIISVLLALALLLSALPISLSASAQLMRTYGLSDVQSIEFNAVRDVYASFDEATAGLAADITFKDGETFYYDFAYGYDYFYDDGYSYYTYEGFDEDFCNGFSFEPERDLDTPGAVRVAIESHFVNADFTYNRSVTVTVAENPVDHIEAVGKAVVNTNNAEERTDWYQPEGGDDWIEKSYVGYSSYAPDDVLVYYTDGSTALLSGMFDDDAALCSRSFDGRSYTKFINGSYPFEGATTYAAREAVKYTSDQIVDPWTEGNTYTATVSYMGHEADYEVEVVEGLPYYPATPDEATRDEENPDYEYAVYNDKAVITDYSGYERNLEIPATIGGYPVDAIGAGAFENNSSLKSVVIPYGVRSIEDNAFYCCRELRSVEIPDSVQRIGYCAFAYNYELRSVEIPDSVTILQGRAFDECTSLENLTIGNSVGSIDYMTFARCESLTSVEIPDSVKYIGEWAFEDCTSLKEVKLSSSVRRIDYEAFFGCKKLKVMTIPASVKTLEDRAIGYGYDRDGNENLIRGFYIYGTEGSAAQTYAEENGILFLLPGEDPPAATEDEAYPEIKVGETKNVTIEDEDETVYFRFVPEKDMLISFYAANDSNNYDHWSIVCDEDFERLSSNEDSCIYYEVEAGNTYYLGTGIWYDTGSYDVTLEEMEIGEISLGERVTLDVDNETYLKFVPEKDMRITYWSESDLDTYGKVYDKDLDMIISNDDSGADNNFKIVCTVEEGKTYYLSVKIYGKKPQKVEVLLEENTDVWSYTERWDDGVEITGYYGDDLDVVIPAEINGLPVTVIGAEAFSQLPITRVVIPDTVHTIDYHAFADSRRLKDIVIPDSVLRIYSYAFADTAWFDDQPNGAVYAGKVAYDYKGKINELNIKDGTKAIAPGAFQNCETLTKVTLPDSLTVIDSSAFKGCTLLKEIEIPPTVTEIGDCALGYTYDDSGNEMMVPGFTVYGYENSIAEIYALDSGFEFVATGVIELPEYEYEIDNGKVTITKYNGRDAEVVIPSVIEGYPVTKIGYEAFRGKPKLTSVTIPETIESIEYDVFENCAKLKTITILCRSASYYGSSFSGCEGCTVYGYEDSMAEDIAQDNEYDFVALDPSGLPEYDYRVEDDGSVTLIKYNGTEEEITTPAYIDGKKVKCVQLYRSKYLKKVTISDGATELAWGAFDSTPNLESIIIPDSVDKVGMYAFTGTKWLQKQYETDPEEPIIYAGKVALYIKDRNTLPKDVKLKKGTTGIADGLFNHSGISSIEIPDSVRTIGSAAFIGCSGLKSVEIPDKVSRIESQTFSMCSSLESVKLPKNLKYIGMAAFGSCPSLKSIELPEGLEAIASSALFTSALTEVTIPASTKTVDMRAFLGCSDMKKATLLNPRTTIEDRALGYGFDEGYNIVKIDGFTICGYNGSTAQTYATANGFDFVSLGDAPDTDKFGYAVNAYYLAGTVNGVDYGYNHISPELRLQPGAGSYSVDTEITKGDKVAIVKYLGDGIFASVFKETEAVNTGSGSVFLQLTGPYSKNMMISVTDDSGEVVDQVESEVRTGGAPVPCDFDDDGEVDVVDVTYLQSFLAKSTPAVSEYVVSRSDVDRNGTTDIVDATFIQRHLAGIEIPYPIG